MKRWAALFGTVALMGTSVAACGDGLPTEAVPPTETVTPTFTPTPETPPDLVISSGMTTMQGFTGGCVVEYGPPVAEVCVQNQGESDVGRFVVRAETRDGVLEIEVKGLAAGEERCFEIGYPVGPVMVDAEGDVVEVNEGNNSYVAITLTPPPICTPTWTPVPQQLGS